jgi:predicted transcriptional regulator
MENRMKTELRQVREVAGLSQIRLAKRARVSRMRLQLAEAGDLELHLEEIRRVEQAIQEAAEEHREKLQQLLMSKQVKKAAAIQA